MSATTSLADFLFPAPARRNTLDIIRWWERRRLAYNAFVGTAGLVSLGAVTVGAALSGAGFVGVHILAPAAVFGVMANACYLLGPALEILIEKLWGRRVLPTGPTLYRMGLTFSVGLALFPTLLVMIVLVVRVLATVMGWV